MHSFFFFLLAIATFAFAEGEEAADLDFSPHPTPWFTGPLLTPSAQTVQMGHVKFDTYLETRVKQGHYDAHWHLFSEDNFYTELLRFKIKIGLADRLEFELIPRVIVQETEGVHSANIGDMPVDLNVQILSPKGKKWGPFLKLIMRASVPFGKYRKLNPYKLRTDETGNGCWFPGPGLVSSYIWHISGFHYIQFRSYAEYRFGTPVHVIGLNAYGGDRKTRGTVYPGNYLILSSALEYTLTQRWALACDFLYETHQRNRFSGVFGEKINRLSRDEFSLAPAFEYSWSKDLGFTGGVWFSLAGRNCPQFVNGIMTVKAYF